MSANSYLQEQMELDECLNFNVEIKSSVQPRWERKALQEQQQQVSSGSSVGGLKTPKSSKKRSRSKTPGKAKTPGGHDRFIPNRGAMDLANAHYNLLSKENDFGACNGAGIESPTRIEFNRTLANSLGASKSRVLAFKKKAPAPPEGHENSLKVLYTQNKEKIAKTKVTRHIPSTSSRILDAPGVLDDYYLNLIDWGSNNVLAVALEQTVYLWNAETGGIEELFTCQAEDDYITSVKFVQEGGGYLAVGTNFCETKLWDVETAKLLRSMDGHSSRVSSLSWNQHILSSGSRDSSIIHHDVRVANHKVATLTGHVQEVCQVAWSLDGQTLASGGNDNLLCLWDARYSDSGRAQVQNPRLKLDCHSAAVKAIAWSPHQRNVLASGGGTACRRLVVSNAANGSCLNSVDTGSQVCSVVWNPYENEILSGHGFSDNQLCLWKYPTMAKIKELRGHTGRVLGTAISPCGTTVCSLGGCETIRFWEVFQEKQVSVKSKRARTTTDRSFQRNIR